MDKAKPLVSVCMPAYNAGKYITEAVNSILGQTWQNIELVIVNDGSTDNTADMLNQLKDTRIKVLHQANRGQCAAANAAFVIATGDLIKFMDADDLISPQFIEEQVKRIGSHEDMISSAAWGRFYEDDLNTFKLVEDHIIADATPIDWLVESTTGKQAMLQCALWLIPRKVLNRSGLWDERLSLINDFEFIIRVLLQARLICFAPNAVLYYRSGVANSLSSLKSPAGVLSAFNSITMGTSMMLQFEDSPRVKKVVADIFQDFVHTYYPGHKRLIQKAKARVNQLGGSTLPFPAGGYTRILVALVGWRLTKRLKSIFKI